MYRLLDDLRDGKTVTQIAREHNCTRAWIYLAMKSAGLSVADFKWYRGRKLSPGARIVASFLVSKHLRIRIRLGHRTRLTVLDEGRPPLELTVHTVTRAHRTNPVAKNRYYGVNTRRTGVVHVVPIDRGIFVVRKEACEGVNLAEHDAPSKSVIPISHLADIEILDVLRANVRS
jgi:hypothetical protein